MKSFMPYQTSRFYQAPSKTEVDADYSINFFYKTKIEKAVDSDIIPLCKFELKAFAAGTKNLVGNVATLIDVVDMVKSYGKSERKTNNAVLTDHRLRIVAQVEDQSGSTIITLFNKEAEQIVGVSEVPGGCFRIDILADYTDVGPPSTPVPTRSRNSP